MGRMMPTVCPHGVYLDWGDFGAEDGSSPGAACKVCDINDEQSFADEIRDGIASYSDPFTFDGVDLAALSLYVARYIRSGGGVQEKQENG